MDKELDRLGIDKDNIKVACEEPEFMKKYGKKEVKP